MESNVPNWKLPKGVSRGTWDYVSSSHIATEYDDYFADSALMQLDLKVLQNYLPAITVRHPHPVIADLGCGTGRVSRLLSPLGYRMKNVDLSRHMLDELLKKTEHPELNEAIEANLVQLDCFEDESLDMAVCLFSSIGMIKGSKHRVQFLSAVCKALKPGSSLFLHAHNRYHSLWDPKGPSWLASTYIKSIITKDWEFGDRVYAYRGLPSMFLHIFSRRELQRELRQAGFTRLKFLPINLTGDSLLNKPWLPSLRAGGYFVVAL